MMDRMYPAYLEAYQNHNLEKAAQRAKAMLEECVICPRKCAVDRLNDKKGFCKTGLKAKVSSFMPHHGEEPPISGKRGSGTIFFSHCNMGCAYCQNYEFSQLGEGREVETGELADFMLELQGMGCHNINLVTPTHVLPQILEALTIAIPKGLKIPLVYNTSGYELPQMLKLLDGIVDIYLPDMRYADSEFSIKYSAAPEYPEHNRMCVKEMYRQVGVADIDNGILKNGLVIRHLVLPNGASGTEKIMRFIAEELSKETYVSLMSQYLPLHRAAEFRELSRPLTEEEYDAAVRIMHIYGLYNGWTQNLSGLARFAGTNIKPSLR